MVTEIELKQRIAAIYGLESFPADFKAIANVSRRQDFSKKNPAYHAITPKYQNAYGKWFDNGRPYGMVASGIPTQRCGSWKWFGCSVGAVVRAEGCEPSYYAEGHPYSCNRPACPACFFRWAFRLAMKSERRAVEYLELINRKVSKRHHFWLLHVVFEGTKNRSKVIAAAKAVGIKGGSLIFHPWRWDRFTSKWRLSPHWHVLGYGWIDGMKVREIYQKKRILIHAIKPSEKRSWFDTIKYELKHCESKQGHHALTYFGEMAYNKFATPPAETNDIVCPCHNWPLVPVIYVGPTAFEKGQLGVWNNPSYFVYKKTGKGPPVSLAVHPMASDIVEIL